MAKTASNKGVSKAVTTSAADSKGAALTRFLLDLAIEPKLQARWQSNAKEVLAERPQLTQAQADALLEAFETYKNIGAAREKLYELLGINQQNP